MKGKLLWLVVATGMLLLLVGFVSKQGPKTDFDAGKELIVMRQIAHAILQYSHDSTTLVSPVIRISESKFQIPFKSSFSFEPDSLVKIIDRIIRSHHLPADYIVQVMAPDSDIVVFGYAILRSEQDNIVPCRGRHQPNLPYTVMISFREKPFTANIWWMAGGICLLLSAVFYAMLKKRKPTGEHTPNEVDATVENRPYAIGNYLFYAEAQRLKLGNEEFVLTSKEAKLLRIFAESPNEIVDRNRLQKEVWEDEGVIVGRSLDVFVSKLRKRLEQDPALKIVSIHGKGYKLEIG